LVLNRAGFDVDVADDNQSLEQQIAAAKRGYDLLVLCHTVRDEERKSLRIIARQSDIPVYQMEPLVSPPELISNVLRLLLFLHGATYCRYTASVSSARILRHVSF
jgi:hypothetical protein